MFGIGFSEILVILIIGLIVLGPEKLPEIAKTLGRAVREFRKASYEIKKSVADLEITEESGEVSHAKDISLKEEEKEEGMSKDA